MRSRGGQGRPGRVLITLALGGRHRRSKEVTMAVAMSRGLTYDMGSYFSCSTEVAEEEEDF